MQGKGTGERTGRSLFAYLELSCVLYGAYFAEHEVPFASELFTNRSLAELLISSISTSLGSSLFECTMSLKFFDTVDAHLRRSVG
jgi:hypothetical protein